MGEQQTLLNRIGGWFRKNSTDSADDPSYHDGNGNGEVLDGGNGLEPRNTFLRPWAKRDQAIDNLQRGIGALSDLLASIRDNMEKQSIRQDELLQHLAHLPEALKALPESGKAHGETLRAIHQQIEQQNAQQSQLGKILERISSADATQGKTLDALHQTVSSMGEHDAAITRNLQTLGSALASVTQNSQASAQVLEQLRDNTVQRDGELERVIRRQNTRFTTLLTVAIVLSVASLSAVAVIGYLAYDLLSRTAK